MSSYYGLGKQGFVIKQQSEILAEMNARLASTYGQNLNTNAASVLQQLIGIFAERIGNIWQLGQAIYASQYPGGAEGESVDNILATNGLKRLTATATTTDANSSVQFNGVPLYGLVLRGVPGTIVPAGSVINTTTAPTLSFTLDNDVAIGAAQSAQQTVILSNAPTMGTFALSIIDPDAHTLATGTMDWSSAADVSRIALSAAPSGGAIIVMANELALGPYTLAGLTANLQANLRAAGHTAAVVTTGGNDKLVYFGDFAPLLGLHNTAVQFGGAPSTGSFALSLNGTPTASIAYNATAAMVQAAIRALPGYGQVWVATKTNGYYINWGITTPPTVTTSANTTAQTLSYSDTYAFTGATGSVVNSVQSQINALQDPITQKFPYTDVIATASGNSFQLEFGATAPQSGQPASGNQPQPALVVVTPSLSNGSTFTNVSVNQNVVGSLAQGIGSATCTVTGPNEVKAGQLSVIGSPLTGWTSVTNQLDCNTGSDTETDSQAMSRRASLLGAESSGPLQSVIDAARSVSGVASATGFQNLTNAAVQTLSFSSIPVAGNFSLALQTATTASIPYDASAATVQAAIQALPGYGTVLVTGTVQYGFQIDFNGSMGGQEQSPILVASNTTGVTIRQGYGRGPHTVEAVVDGGNSTAVARAIYGEISAGIGTYGAPTAVTTGSTAATTTLTVASAVGIELGNNILGPGLPFGCTVANISGTTITLSSPSLGTYTGTYIFNHGILITDDQGNPFLVNYSRPQEILVYVSLTLLTDTYLTPGDPTSGARIGAKFNPQTIPTIQADIVADAAANFGIGALLVAVGTDGISQSFTDVPGILGFTFLYGVSPSPTSNANIQLLPNQIALWEESNVIVSWT